MHSLPIPLPPLPGLGNPIGDILGGLGDAAGQLGASVFNEAMQAVWEFASMLLGGVLRVIDRYTQPDVDPTNGPLAGLLPTSTWLGAVVLVVMAFVQTGRAVMHGGRGLGRIGIGLAQYVVVTSTGLAVLGTLVAASDALAKGILSNGLGIDSWEGLNGQDSVLEGTVEAISGVGLGLIALFCVLPAAIALLVEALVRNAAILVLAGTIPILAGGLISEATRRWFWTGLRWMLALLMMTPAVAFTLVLGLRVAEGAAGGQGQQQDPVQAAVAAVIAGMVLIIATCCPLALFKLFAFVDPNSLSGAAVRGFFGGQVSGGSTAGAAAGATAGSSEQSAQEASEGMFSRVFHAMDETGPWAAGIAAQAGGILDAVGAGHPGGPGGGGARRAGGHAADRDTGSDEEEPDDWTPDEDDRDPDDGWNPDDDGWDSGDAWSGDDFNDDFFNNPGGETTKAPAPKPPGGGEGTGWSSVDPPASGRHSPGDDHDDDTAGAGHGGADSGHGGAAGGDAAGGAEAAAAAV